MVDVAIVGLRALALAAALHAAGTAFFLYLLGPLLDRSARAIGRLAVYAAVGGALLTIAHLLAEPARLAGSLSGILDPVLRSLLLESDLGTTAAVRVLGLGFVAAGCAWPGRPGFAAAATGAALAAASFAFIGHTAAGDGRWLAAPLLIGHVLIVAFWLGALIPLLLVLWLEAPAAAGRIVAGFSAFAAWLVPVILVTGLALSILLLPGLQSLLTPYGLLLVTKVTAFAALLGLAALNKWRLGPRIGGDRAALKALRRSVLAEWVLIMAVVGVTAFMTGLFSP